jgi:hypothetical protein
MTSRPEAIRRSEYLIDHYHVIFESGAGWQCVCAEFTATHDCRHTRESKGRRAAQAVIANRLLRSRGLIAIGPERARGS